MSAYEYKVVPAPKKGVKTKGARTQEARFAHALQTLMNEQGTDGWEYQRTDTLPCEERQGFTGRTTTYQNMLVFRRTLVSKAETQTVSPPMVEAPKPVPAPIPNEPVFKRAVAEPEDAPQDIEDSFAEGGDEQQQERPLAQQ
ncbi:MAG: DUF4177 domain-containing protein [Marinosulfonomonas sp.]